MSRTSSNISILSKQICNDLLACKYECNICFDRIGNHASIWHCSNCFVITHLSCIKKWSSSINDKDIPCPVCRITCNYKTMKNFCFCGKVQNPKYFKNKVPHTCNNICNKINTCNHPCKELCHPGPCSQCKELGEIRSCYCGKKNYQSICGKYSKGISCKNRCGKLLDCGIHNCNEICHNNACLSCTVETDYSCFCGKESKLINCFEYSKHNGYSCDNICGKILSCGNCYCTLPCHNGNCMICERDISKNTCPCGTTPLNQLVTKPRSSCLDEYPCCQLICNKLLSCGLHYCKEKCHIGMCNPCPEKTKGVCRCGKTTQLVNCIDVNPIGNTPKKEITCDNVCMSKKSCYKHKCFVKCCPLSNIGSKVHECSKICNKPLSCKNHQCQRNCHRGKCDPCLNASFDEVTCTCKKTIMYPPIACGASLPECSHLCSRDHKCNHPVNHLCHYNDECPKCYALVTRKCGCGKKHMTTKCYIEFPCCGDICKKPLPCGNHFCNKPCHPGSCSDTQPGESCGQSCNKKLANCSHTCNLPCHPDDNLCEEVCSESVVLRCTCGKRIKAGLCENDKDHYVRLDCNDLCNLQLMESQYYSQILEKSSISYSESLLTSAKCCYRFVNKVEHTFIALINSNRMRTHHFPPMNSYYRRIIHQLAEIYGLQTKSVDMEPNRSVIITKTKTSSIPIETLIQTIAKDKTPQKIGNLLFYNLTSKIQAEHIHYALKAYEGEYNLHWINNESAIAIFKNENKMKEASYFCSTSDWFNVAPIMDNDVSIIFSK